MNEVLMRMRGKKMPLSKGSHYPHLWLLLEIMAQIQPQYGRPQFDSNDDQISIRFAEKGKRMRNVVRRSNSKATGKFPSAKNNRTMQWESIYELEAFRILEISPLVISYQEQPAEFKYRGSDGVDHIHFPDLLVELCSGAKVFIEIKPKRAALDDLVGERTALLADLLAPNGFRYLLILPEQTHSQAYLENAKHLLQHSKTPMPDTIWEAVRRLFTSEAGISLFALVQKLNDQNARSWIYQLLIKGVIRCDLSKPLSLDTEFHWNNG